MLGQVTEIPGKPQVKCRDHYHYYYYYDYDYYYYYYYHHYYYYYYYYYYYLAHTKQPSEFQYQSTHQDLLHKSHPLFQWNYVRVDYL